MLFLRKKVIKQGENAYRYAARGKKTEKEIERLREREKEIEK